MIIKIHYFLQVCSYSYWNWLYLCDIHHTIAVMNTSHMTLMTHMEVELDLLYGC